MSQRRIFETGSGGLFLSIARKQQRGVHSIRKRFRNRGFIIVVQRENGKFKVFMNWIRRTEREERRVTLQSSLAIRVRERLIALSIRM
jgi:hypothetical protein